MCRAPKLRIGLSGAAAFASRAAVATAEAYERKPRMEV
jgi:hypothetical protein